MKAAKSSSGSVSITDDEFYFICCLVYGEAGDEPYDGQVLVAQCFYNAMKESGMNAYDTRSAYGYYGSTSKGTSESVKKAVRAVFYEGYRYTDAEVLYFYAPSMCKSSWHESQIFVCEVGGHRFFAKRD
ncbi:cell wall hydrolase [Candidatus Saccharibacteria bacterium]|nr:cell wall hydrolase [Candidatus Saccharibacteria bacterium]